MVQGNDGRTPHGAGFADFKTILIGLVFAAVVAGLLLGVQLCSNFVGAMAAKTAYVTVPPVRGFIDIAGMLLVVWIARVAINKKPWTGLALPMPQWGHLLLGCILGAAAILAISGIEYVQGWLHIVSIDTSPHRGIAKIALILLQLAPSLGVGFSEELAFRGYVFQTLGERMPVWASTLATGIIFGLIHFTLNGFGGAFVLSVALISTMFLAMRFATGSLWFPIGFHALWDWTQTYFIGVGNVGTKGYDPALIHVTQSGPALWVGSGQAVEYGLDYILAAALITLIVLAYGAATGRPVPWGRRMTPEGD